MIRGTPAFANWIEDPDPDEHWGEEDHAEMRRRLRRHFGTLEGLDDASWDENKHPRGQPENKGQFGPGGGGSSTKSKSARGVKARKGKDIKRSGLTQEGASAAAALAAVSARRAGKKSGADGHPGEGYSKEAKVKNGVIHTTNVDDAVKALQEHRKVELDQPRGVSIALEKLGRIAERMIEKGEKAPTINLCNLSVKGSNLFCVGNKEMTRDLMPQMDEKQTAQFLVFLKDKGYTVTNEEQYASHLRATQNELNGVKVAGIAKAIRENQFDPTQTRTVISDDDYVLDGHHRWAAKVGNDSHDNILTNDSKYPVSRINIKITQLLEEAEIFTGGKGKKGVGEGTETPQQVTEAEKEKAAAAKKDMPVTGGLKAVEKAAAPKAKKETKGEQVSREMAEWDDYPDAAGSEAFAEGYVEALQASADEMADKYGFPKENLAIKMGVPRTAGGMAAGVYDFASQKIGIFPMVGEPSPQSIKTLLAHEMTHHSHNMAMQAWRKEAGSMSPEERKAYQNEEDLDALAKKYPTAAAMRPFAMDKVLEPQNVRDGKRVSAYAAEFWQASKKDPQAMVLATSETLAEVAHAAETGGLDRKNISQFWRDHYETVQRLHKERRA